MSIQKLATIGTCNQREALELLGVLTKDNTNKKRIEALDHLKQIERENRLTPSRPVYFIQDVLTLRETLMPLKRPSTHPTTA